MSNQGPNIGFAKFFDEKEFGKPDSEEASSGSIKNQADYTKQAQPESYRFLILALYCLYAALGSVLINCFSPIVKTLANVYGASTWEVYALTNLYLYSGAILNFPLLFLLQKLGNRHSLTTGLALMLIGSVIKLFMDSGMNFAIAGHVFCVLGYEFLNPIIGAINCLWFPASSRVIVFTIANMAYSLGTVGSFLTPTLFVTEDHPSVEANRQEVYHLKIFCMSLSALVFVLHLFLFKEKPNFPLSEASTISRHDFFPSIKILIKNKNFLLLMLGMAFLISVQYTRYNNYYFLIKPFGFSQSQAGYLASIEGWGEIFGLIFIMVISTRTKQPKLVLNWIPLGVCILLAIMLALFNFNSFLASAIVGFFLGVLFNSFPPLCENYSVAVTFPVSENMVVGTIFTGGLWGAWATGALTTALRDNLGEQAFLYILYPYFFILILSARIVFVRMKDVNLREAHEKNGG